MRLSGGKSLVASKLYILGSSEDELAALLSGRSECVKESESCHCSYFFISAVLSSTLSY